MARILAIVGATGAVGKQVVKLVEQRQLPVDDAVFIASPRSAGCTLMFRGKTHLVQPLTEQIFRGVDVVIGVTPDEVAREFAPWAIAGGAIVVDESGAHRMLDHVPLVIPEVNPQAIADHCGIISSPNCSTTQMVMALKPLHDFGRVTRVIVTTFQAVSGAGQMGVDQLLVDSQGYLQQRQNGCGRQSTKDSVFQHPIAFNLIPHIGSPRYQNYTSEEMKMVWETQKIFADDSLLVCPTCVRVPVFNCHSESLVVETQLPISVDRARELWGAAPGIAVCDDLTAGQYPMPVAANDRDEVYVGRIRQDLCCPHRLVFWTVSDNLRKGAATNAVQIAELILRDYL